MGIIDIVILSAAAELLIFALFLAVRGVTRRRELLWLALFFFSLALNILNYFLFRRSDFFYPDYARLYYLGAPFAYLYPPCFYLYLRRSTQGPPLRRPLVLLHFAPFVLFAGFLCVTYYFRDEAAQRTLLSSPAFLPNAGYIALTVAVQAQILFYAALGLRLLLSYRRRLKAAYSSIESIKFAWLEKLAIGLAVLWVLDLARFAGNLAGLGAANVFESALYIVFALFCCFILFNALEQPRVFLEEEALPAKPIRKSLSGKTAASYRAALELIMEKEKPHLEPELSLAGLAQRAGIPARSLSEAIRSGKADNFYDFVNEYRVREFIRLREDPARQGWTVLDLMLEAGFNSKSAFNKAFKKKTGQIPRVYMSRQQPKA
jgi:AraC-like DNA-binding protein